MDELLEQALAELDAGNFTRLENLILDNKVSLIDLLTAAGRPQQYLDEGFAWACMLGRTEDAEALLDLGADPVAGMKTGMAGAHYAASGGHLNTIEMLIRRGVPLETINMYGGTVLGQALWSAINEHRASHGEIIEALIDAGAVIAPGTERWWLEQDVPSEQTKLRVLDALRQSGAK